MSVCAPPQDDSAALPDIGIEKPDPRAHLYPSAPLERNAILPDNHFTDDSLPTYSTSDIQRKFVSKFDVWSSLSPPRAEILELLRPEDPCKEALEAIVRPVQRRGLVRPYDEDTRRFIQKVLLSPSSATIQSESRLPVAEDRGEDSEAKQKIDDDSKKVRSLADELREAEEDERSGENIRRELLREFRKRGGGIREALERDRLGKLALAVEDDEVYEECGLSAAARRLDALLMESRSLHEELAGIHEDMQAQCARACRCAAAARALTAESRSLRYLDDVVALLRGDVTAAHRTKSWPFAMGRRLPDRNYIV